GDGLSCHRIMHVANGERRARSERSGEKPHDEDTTETCPSVSGTARRPLRPACHWPLLNPRSIRPHAVSMKPPPPGARNARFSTDNNTDRALSLISGSPAAFLPKQPASSISARRQTAADSLAQERSADCNFDAPGAGRSLQGSQLLR